MDSLMFRPDSEYWEDGISQAYLNMDSFLIVRVGSVQLFWSSCYVVSILPSTELDKFLAFKQLVSLTEKTDVEQNHLISVAL